MSCAGDLFVPRPMRVEMRALMFKNSDLCDGTYEGFSTKKICQDLPSWANTRYLPLRPKISVLVANYFAQK